MVKIVIDAGDETTVSGKRTPVDDSEWLCNDKVVQAVVAELETYEGVEILRVDDPTGRVDIPLQTRTNQANEWKADVYVAIHHNVLWVNEGKHNRIETNPMNHPDTIQQSEDSTSVRYPRIVKSMEIRNRGKKQVNLHVFRETAIPAILKEGGFMDSIVDIIKLRDEKYLRAEGEAIAKGLAAYIKLKPKSESENSRTNRNKGVDIFYTPTAEELVEATMVVLQHLESDSEGVIPSSWLKKIQDGTLTDSDSVCLLYVVIHRWLTQETD